MRQRLHTTVLARQSGSQVWQGFPWSKVMLSFFMTSSFLIFATLGANSAETGVTWTDHVSEILAGTAVFSLAAILLLSAGRLLPKNF
ncbi:hypothetical protein [Paremcibacter congregatus]|uniref:Uncharacterized protein n=1 Tax=Paremcibacter congregatus TaxID=2043170 RepID=A0A2G4YQB4_9PROT|nr:hypothetical protein [Paremcibacter congregatus]PHZ84521.1 hypothetical protein CRD36_12000 [Paremcibacter congregatus]QDE28740.1 hypothetical protein FIV45_16410 [Paremcibacter congregatus]|tara:strand:- start:602 stop:862 length:261 start_codon:yes stop_codon:yes gene_type:complete